MSARAVIADVDGTLCDVSTALHHLPDFTKFHQATSECPATPEVVEWCRIMQSTGCVIAVVTARKYQHQELTERWLARHLDFPYIGPFMRGDHDDRPDTEVKRDIHRILTEDYGFRIQAAIDDRPSVIRFWQSMGVPVRVVYRRDWEAAGESYEGLLGENSLIAQGRR
jgi:phosphoglycolate phosphatase-like HAD superfamily hydrolase